MSDKVLMKRALLSVSDKTGVVEFARILHEEFGVELISTGGTAIAFRKAGLTVLDVSEVTGFPEMMDGRVKTLHPMVHGGILAQRDEESHVASMTSHNIQPIDLVCVNLYPFEQAVADPACTLDHAIENIDVGGPTLIRAAAKNHRWVCVVTDALQYDKVLTDLRVNGGSSSSTLRFELAAQAFAQTARYDQAIANYLLRQTKTQSALPEQISLSLNKRLSLRYGENPHQQAALYVTGRAKDEGDSVATAIQHHGKELSYINLLDADAAWRCVHEFQPPAACIVKHATPCGVAVASDLSIAFSNAFDCDPVAAFGGIVALNRIVDFATASHLVGGQKFIEVIVACGFEPGALSLLKERWKNVRLLEIHSRAARPLDAFQLHKIDGGLLVQEEDDSPSDPSKWTTASQRSPTSNELNDLQFAWLACKHVKSNAIVIARNGATVGIGGGQVDRVGAARIAIEKAGHRTSGAVAASDAFFPFPDGPQLLLNAGVTAIVQPGGSQRDALTIDAANASGAAMLVTGRRHFKH